MALEIVTADDSDPVFTNGNAIKAIKISRRYPGRGEAQRLRCGLWQQREGRWGRIRLGVNGEVLHLAMSLTVVYNSTEGNNANDPIGSM